MPSTSVLSEATGGASPARSVDAPIPEVVKLAAEDYQLYGRTFFPKTLRQASPPMHEEIWDALATYSARYVNIQVFRDGAKTTILRLFTSHRIAYAESNTILYIGKSEGHAIRSVSWIRRQVEFNRRWAQTYGLAPGSKWQDVECEIMHSVLEQPIWILATGITGSVRGINRDDFRPDLIIIDDVIDDENAATIEQCRKISDRIHGAIKGSLAPRSEAPNALIAMLQTPLSTEDASTKALSDPSWRSLVFPCWTKETLGLPIDQQISVWEERYPTLERREEKRAALAANQAHLWYREKECKLVAPESSDFREEWLKHWSLIDEPEALQIVIGVDPVPPPSETQIQKGLARKDYEVFAVCARCAERYYVLEIRSNRGHQPEWTLKTFFELRKAWRPRKFVIEPTGYQRTLKWIIEQEMLRRSEYAVIDTKDGEGYFSRRKRDRILDGIQPVASQGQLYIHQSMTTFIDQFANYPAVSHDDELDAVATALGELQESDVLEGEFTRVDGAEENDDMTGFYGAP